MYYKTLHNSKDCMLLLATLELVRSPTEWSLLADSALRADIDSRLLHYAINYECKKFYSSGLVRIKWWFLTTDDVFMNW